MFVRSHSLSPETTSLLRQALLGLCILGLALLYLLIEQMIAFASEPTELPQSKPSILQSPATIRVEPRRFTYRLPGEFSRDGQPILPHLSQASLSYPLHVMVHQVTRREYRRCVMANACSQPYEAYIRMDGSEKDEDWDVPVAGVSFEDATRYAQWLSKQTSKIWRLPSDLEWAAFAAERYFDDLPPIEGDPLANTISRPELYKYQTSRYEQEENQEDFDPIPKVPGWFGTNSLGVADLSGNIWEWTTTCYDRVRFTGSSDEPKKLTNCGVLVIEGKLRAYMSSFIRDPVSGECSVSIPLDNLGFRLVRDAETSFWQTLSRPF